MMRRPPGRPVPAAGFTLVEVLIALALLSLLMLVLVGAMRAMGQTEERVEQRIDQRLVDMELPAGSAHPAGRTADDVAKTARRDRRQIGERLIFVRAGLAGEETA